MSIAAKSISSFNIVLLSSVSLGKRIFTTVSEKNAILANDTAERKSV